MTIAAPGSLLHQLREAVGGPAAAAQAAQAAPQPPQAPAVAPQAAQQPPQPPQAPQAPAAAPRALPAAISYGPTTSTPTGPACQVLWHGHPVATLTRTDQPAEEAWEPGMPGPVKVPGFTVYTLASTRSSRVLSSMHPDALMATLVDALQGAAPTGTR